MPILLNKVVIPFVGSITRWLLNTLANSVGRGHCHRLSMSRETSVLTKLLLQVVMTVTLRP